MLYELINPSDAYTFHAPSLEVAGVCAVLLSTGFGAKPLEGDSDETTPILFGWQEWLDHRGINSEWIDTHAAEIAEAYESFLIGDESKRADVEAMLAILAMLPKKKREQWRAERQDRHLSSMNAIGERAYELAKKFRGVSKRKPVVS